MNLEKKPIVDQIKTFFLELADLIQHYETHHQKSTDLAPLHTLDTQLARLPEVFHPILLATFNQYARYRLFLGTTVRSVTAPHALSAKDQAMLVSYVLVLFFGPDIQKSLDGVHRSGKNASKDGNQLEEPVAGELPSVADWTHPRFWMRTKASQEGLLALPSKALLYLLRVLNETPPAHVETFQDLKKRKAMWPEADQVPGSGLEKAELQPQKEKVGSNKVPAVRMASLAVLAAWSAKLQANFVMDILKKLENPAGSAYPTRSHHMASLLKRQAIMQEQPAITAKVTGQSETGLPSTATTATTARRISRTAVSSQFRVQPKAPTVPEPFLLTVPRPRPVHNSIPIRIPNNTFRARRAPKASTQEQTNVILMDLERRKETRHAMAERRKKILEEKNAPSDDLVPHPKKALSAPSPPPTLAKMPLEEVLRDPKNPVKITKASVLREDAFVQRQIDEERRKIEHESTLGMAGTMTTKEVEQRLREQKAIGNYFFLKLHRLLLTSFECR